MAITVTLPIAAPTGLSSTLQSGGNLLANTTYYYVVIAFESAYVSPGTGRFNYHSPISAEGTFTTDSTNKSVLIKWTNVTNATNYNILISTTSGNYKNIPAFGTTSEGVGTITDGTVGYTVTGVATGTHVIHSVQLANDLPGNLTKDGGILKVVLDGTTTYNLKNIYDAIITAGYSSYVDYDGYNFTYKGWIYANTTDAGNLVVERQRLIFVKGGVCIDTGSNYKIRFGRWVNDNKKADPTYGCSIDILNSRTPFKSYVSGALQMYGSIITDSHSRKNTETELLTYNYYYAGWSMSLNYYTDKYNDTLLGIPGRGGIGNIKDLKWKQLNNFGNGTHIRLNINKNARLPYYAGGKFYNCTWYDNNATNLSMNIYVPANGALYYSNFYDCMFPLYSNNIPVFTYLTNYGNVTSNSYTQHNYSLNIKVIDKNGNPLSDVNVSIKDQFGNSGVWIEHDTTIDKIVTGNEYTTARVTDSNGIIDTFYIKSYKVNLHPDNTEAASYCDNVVFTKYYPFIITLSKTGYSDYSIILDTLLESTDLLIKYTKSGDITSNNDFKFITHKKINGVL
jgi:hypothetical protein